VQDFFHPKLWWFMVNKFQNTRLTVYCDLWWLIVVISTFAQPFLISQHRPKEYVRRGRWKFNQHLCFCSWDLKQQKIFLFRVNYDDVTAPCGKPHPSRSLERCRVACFHQISSDPWCIFQWFWDISRSISCLSYSRPGLSASQVWYPFFNFVAILEVVR
jgi:hypothetical protein